MSGVRKPWQLLLQSIGWSFVAWVSCLATFGAATEEIPRDWKSTRSFLQSYCIDCHDDSLTKGGLDLEKLSNSPKLGSDFLTWEKAIEAVSAGKMPPKGKAQPNTAARKAWVEGLRTALSDHQRRHAGDPGIVRLRRLTGAEYDYAIQDLTGLNLELGSQFINDAVGGEGFSNVGEVQFLDESGLERYLEAAKTVATHAMIGASPLAFFPHRGLTGLEISAMERIQEVYRAHGFRKAAGEGAEPYGQDRYPKAFFVAWQYRHRQHSSKPKEELEDIAQREGIAPRFAKHVWSVLHAPSPSFPISEIAKLWSDLPTPTRRGKSIESEVRVQCADLHRKLDALQSALASGQGNNEEAPVLTAGIPKISEKRLLKLRLPVTPSHPVPTLHCRIRPIEASKDTPFAVVIRDLRTLLVDDSHRTLPFGIHPLGGKVSTNDLVISKADPFQLQFKAQPGVTNVGHNVEIELDVARTGDVLVQADFELESAGVQPPLMIALLADPAGQGFRRHQEGLGTFANHFPQVSHREPAPSDRDPIPAPYSNQYESPDRNYFHYTVKYHRDDAFLVEHMLDDNARLRLDEAWADLLLAFEYHDIKLRFLDRKYKLGLKNKTTDELTDSDLASWEQVPRDFAIALRTDKARLSDAWRRAEAGHLTGTLDFARRAWRRPLNASEQSELQAFYQRIRNEHRLSHADAIRSVLARILVSPSFLYRLEPRPERPSPSPLTPRQLAARLSFFLWSSIPDDELGRAADAGELDRPKGIEKQVRRMLQDPRSRRFSEQFFGQWFGFHKFDQHAQVDRVRFPEFTPALSAALYEEAVAFFEHITKQRRPVDEILNANYSFLNDALARHYQTATPAPLGDKIRIHRHPSGTASGLLRLGAVLTKTSTPLRTSPVKRGDWILRNVLGTPPPPPPPDAGSLASDDVLPDGLSVPERLEAHRKRESCANCHALFDPLGLGLERFDPIGRPRDRYRDGKPIDTTGTLADGSQIEGFEGLNAYLLKKRTLFHHTLSSRMLGFALGRKVLLSDRPLLNELVSACDRGDSVEDLAVRIANSTQFRLSR